MPEYSTIVTDSQNPFTGLSSKQIDLYFFLKMIHKNLEYLSGQKPMSNMTVSVLQLNSMSIPSLRAYEGCFEISNEDIAGLVKTSVRTVSVNIKALRDCGIIELKYTPNKMGVQRRIYWKGLPNE